jgi:hypothetical protein
VQIDERPMHRVQSRKVWSLIGFQLSGLGESALQKCSSLFIYAFLLQTLRKPFEVLRSTLPSIHSPDFQLLAHMHLTAVRAGLRRFSRFAFLHPSK